jgi:hypothetical protein
MKSNQSSAMKDMYLSAGWPDHFNTTHFYASYSNWEDLQTGLEKTEEPLWMLKKLSDALDKALADIQDWKQKIEDPMYWDENGKDGDGNRRNEMITTLATKQDAVQELELKVIEAAEMAQGVDADVRRKWELNVNKVKYGNRR